MGVNILTGFHESSNKKVFFTRLFMGWRLTGDASDLQREGPSAADMWLQATSDWSQMVQCRGALEWVSGAIAMETWKCPTPAKCKSSYLCEVLSAEEALTCVASWRLAAASYSQIIVYPVVI